MKFRNSISRDLAIFVAIVMVVYLANLGADFYENYVSNNIRGLLIATLEGTATSKEIDVVDPLKFSARCKNKKINVRNTFITLVQNNLNYSAICDPGIALDIDCVLRPNRICIFHETYEVQMRKMDERIGREGMEQEKIVPLK